MKRKKRNASVRTDHLKVKRRLEENKEGKTTRENESTQMGDWKKDKRRQEDEKDGRERKDEMKERRME